MLLVFAGRAKENGQNDNCKVVALFVVCSAGWQAANGGTAEFGHSSEPKSLLCASCYDQL